MIFENFGTSKKIFFLKAENDLKREKKENSEQRKLARLERKERRKREKEENRQRKNANKLIISTTATNENLPNIMSSISTNAASTPMPFANNNDCMDDDNDEENNGVNKTVFFLFKNFYFDRRGILIWRGTSLGFFENH